MKGCVIERQLKCVAEQNLQETAGSTTETKQHAAYVLGVKSNRNTNLTARSKRSKA